MQPENEFRTYSNIPRSASKFILLISLAHRFREIIACVQFGCKRWHAFERVNIVLLMAALVSGWHDTHITPIMLMNIFSRKQACWSTQSFNSKTTRLI